LCTQIMFIGAELSKQVFLNVCLLNKKKEFKLRLWVWAAFLHCRLAIKVWHLLGNPADSRSVYDNKISLLFLNKNIRISMLVFFQGLIFTNIGKINNLGNASFNDFVEQIIIVTKKYSIIERQQDCCYFLTDIIENLLFIILIKTFTLFWVHWMLGLFPATDYLRYALSAN
jgi:hypothetical protein